MAPERLPAASDEDPRPTVTEGPSCSPELATRLHARKKSILKAVAPPLVVAALCTSALLLRIRPLAVLFGVLLACYVLEWTFKGSRKILRHILVNLVRCPHGIVGGRHVPSRCATCYAETEERRAAAEAEAKRAATEQARRRRREYDEYRARIRLPSFLCVMDPYEFEHLVCEVYRRKGYNVQETPRSGDGGVDGYLRMEGKLYLLQCKRTKGRIGEPVVRDLYGAITHERAAGGVLVTTGSTSDSARKWANGKPIQILELDQVLAMVKESFPEDEVVPRHWQPTAADVHRRRHRRS